MLLDDDGAGAGGAHAPDVDVLNRKKQTPLMLAAMHGRTDCALRLLQAGANVLTTSLEFPLFRSLQGHCVN